MAIYLHLPLDTPTHRPRVTRLKTSVARFDFVLNQYYDVGTRSLKYVGTFSYAGFVTSFLSPELSALLIAGHHVFNQNWDCVNVDLLMCVNDFRYPSKVFVGDTFCYVSGMTFAVVGILSHFSKTVLLFFLPQIINFLYSVPQLFHFVPCPRHRLPKYSGETDLLQASRTVIIKKDVNVITKVIVKILTMFRLVHVVEDNNDTLVMNNLTLINLFLIKLGPMSEVRLTTILMIFQCFCSCIAFIIRYPMASYFYDT